MKDYTNPPAGVNEVVATNAMSIVLPAPLLKACRIAISDPQFIARFEALTGETEFQAGFLMARRLHKVLLYEDIDVKTFDPTLFEALIEEWGREWCPTIDWEVLQFNLEESWKLVKVPEGETHFSIACRAVSQGKYDGELDPNIRIGPPAMQRRAALLAALIRACSETMRKPFLTSRQASAFLGCNQSTVIRLLVRLANLGVYQVTGKIPYKTNPKKSAHIFKWISQSERPKIASSELTEIGELIGCSGVSSILDTDPAAQELTQIWQRRAVPRKTETRSENLPPTQTTSAPDSSMYNIDYMDSDSLSDNFEPVEREPFEDFD